MDLFSNQLSGSIPSELGNLRNLRYLDLDTNQLSGSIPSELGNLRNLLVVQLYGNQLSGSIPPELGSLRNLEFLNLGDNRLSGSIPPELGGLRNLQRMLFHNNQLSGSLPDELGYLEGLSYVWVHNNRLSGEIPAGLNVRISFKFCSNQITGSLPAHLRAVVTDFSGDFNDVESCYEGLFNDDDGFINEVDINQAARWGIVQGCGDNRFCPNRIVNRAQIAAFLYRTSAYLYGTPDPVEDEVELADADADSWYWTAAQWAVANEVMSAPGGRFDSQASVTMVEMAAMLVAAFDFLPSAEAVLGFLQRSFPVDVSGLPLTRALMASILVSLIPWGPTPAMG